MMWIPRGDAPVTRIWALLAMVVLSVTALTACEDGTDPGCAQPGDPPLMSVGDSGGPICDPPEPDCDGCGGAWGDPHITTLDGVVYDLQAVGEFTVAAMDDVEVQARFSPWGNSRTVSVVTGVAIAVQGRTVSMTVDQVTRALTVRVDGQERDLTQAPITLGEGLVGIAPGGDYVVAWPDGSMVAVSHHGSYLSLLVDAAANATSAGLLGDLDGDREDLFTTREGTDLGVDLSHDQLYGEFAHSWRITDDTSAFWYAEGTSTKTFTDLTFPDEHVTLDSFSTEQRAAALAVCEAAGITERTILDACILDVAATGDSSFAQAALTAQEHTNGTPLHSTAGGKASEEVAWVTILEGLRLSEPDLAHASDSRQIYVLVNDAESTPWVTAIDASTGMEVWRVAGVVPTCGVAVLDSGRLAVVGQADGPLNVDGLASIAVLDSATGATLAATSWAAASAFATYCSPMMVAGDVLVMTNEQSSIQAWDVSQEPTPAWEVSDLDRVSAALVRVEDAFVLTSAGEAGGRQAVLIDAATGTIVDTHAIAGRDHQRNGIAMVVSGQTVVVSLVGDMDDGTRLGTITAVTATGDALEKAWEFAVWSESAGKDADHTVSRGLSAFSAGDGLIIGHAGNELLAIDVATGRLAWRYTPSGFRWTDAAAPIVEGVIWDGAFGGPLISRVSTHGEFLGETFGDDLVAGWPRGATAQIFGPVVGNVMVITSHDEDGNVVVLGIDAKR